MAGTSREFIWRGRIHLGDEPGVYGDASYAGLGCDLPLTVREFEENPPDTATFVLAGENVGIHPGYPGHAVQVVLYEETEEPNHYRERVLREVPLVPVETGPGGTEPGETEIAVDLASAAPKPGAPRYLSIRVRLDTSVPPALYDDFLLVGLWLRSTKYYASFGFH